MDWIYDNETTKQELVDEIEKLRKKLKREKVELEIYHTYNDQIQFIDEDLKKLEEITTIK